METPKRAAFPVAAVAVGSGLPYGFKVGQGDADMPNPSPVDDETPVSE